MQSFLIKQKICRCKQIQSVNWQMLKHCVCIYAVENPFKFIFYAKDAISLCWVHMPFIAIEWLTANKNLQYWLSLLGGVLGHHILTIAVTSSEHLAWSNNQQINGSLKAGNTEYIKRPVMWKSHVISSCHIEPINKHQLRFCGKDCVAKKKKTIPAYIHCTVRIFTRQGWMARRSRLRDVVYMEYLHVGLFNSTKGVSIVYIYIHIYMCVFIYIYINLLVVLVCMYYFILHLSLFYINCSIVLI